MAPSDPGYFQRSTTEFGLLCDVRTHGWRPPQLGALGALLAYWSRPQSLPALVSLPTGVGKTAVGIAAPHMFGARRVLVVVPSAELRRQMVRSYRSQQILRDVGALKGEQSPTVVELTRRVGAWSEIEHADVVVAHPNSISPTHYQEPPPASLFDMIVVDEAHHTPAPTWRAILEHFDAARAVMLTATPKRSDGQNVPGEIVYHYPLRQALIEQIFQPIEPLLLPAPDNADRRTLDTMIAERAHELLHDPQHATSAMLVRARSVQRATELAALYEERGIEVPVLYSRLGEQEQREIVQRLKQGDCRAVAVVGMLIEGFDLPRLRIVAYHDKHKSLLPTAQLLGRLARVDRRFPQPSVVVTANDVDVYPELKGAVRLLYDEDEDWASILPGIIDEEIAQEIADRTYVRRFQTSSSPVVTLEAVHPLRRAVILEIPPGTAWMPGFAHGILPDELRPGHLLRGADILYAGLSPDNHTMVVATRRTVRPPWFTDAGLDGPHYDLLLLSYRPASRTDLPGLLLVNTSDGRLWRALEEVLEIGEDVRAADPARLHEAFDSLERISVSSVGMRNTYGGTPGIPSYKIFAGSGVDRGLREADTAFGAVGHAIVQVASSEGVAYTAGMAAGKSKYWETRYTPLRQYEEFITGLAERYWFPPTSTAGQLLPQVSRGNRLRVWPTAPVVAVELDAALIGRGWNVVDVGPIEALELSAEPGDTPSTLTITVSTGANEPVWRGVLDVSGVIAPIGEEVYAQRGFSDPEPLSELLTDRPPTIFFLDGATVHGPLVFNSRSRARIQPAVIWTPHTWQDDVDITAETRRTAQGHGRGRSVQEAFEEVLLSAPRRGRHRWIILNDGKCEIADYLVLEVDRNEVYLSLWHVKAAGGSGPAVRVTDLQEVVAQAIKNRGWITDVRLWAELGARLNGRASPTATLIEGNRFLLEVLCGEVERWNALSFRRRTPVMHGQIGIVQPGLGHKQFQDRMVKGTIDASVTQVRDLLSVLHDSVSVVAQSVTVVCSP